MQTLTSEQEFRIAALKLEIQSMSEQEIKQKLCDIHIQMIVSETLWKQQIKEKWGIGG